MARVRITPGQRFGQLEVIERAESTPSGQTRWRCRCDCGRETLAMDSNLKRGKTTSCGCRRERNLAGQRIGRLTVLERSDRYAPRGDHQVRLWKCRCDCGAITYKATDVLTNDAVNMCRRCAEEYAMTKARAAAGFTQGTQLTKLARTDACSENASGIRGVYLDHKTGKYRARIKFQGKLYNLGTYSTLEEAVAARREGEERYFKTFLARIGDAP